MDKQRQPDYDFFTPPRPPETPAGTPAGHHGPFGAIPGQRATFPPSPHFGSAPPAAAPGTTQAFPGRWAPPAAPVTKRRRLPGRRAIAACVTAVALTAGTFFFAVPKVQAHAARAEWESTTVETPATFEGIAATAVGYGKDVTYQLPDGTLTLQAEKTERPYSNGELGDMARDDRRRIQRMSHRFGMQLVEARAPRGADHLHCVLLGRGFICLVLSNSVTMRVVAVRSTRDPVTTARELWAATVHRS